MVTQMTIPEKLESLAACISQCDNVEYSIQARLGDNKEETLRELLIIVENGKKLFMSGSVDNLDYDVRQEAYAKWDNILNEKLSLFPEYSVELEEPRMHM